VLAEEGMTWVRPDARFAGYVHLTSERGPPGYERLFLKGPSGGRLSLATFGAETADQDPLFAMMFGEARVATRLWHPRLARVLELDHDDAGYWCLSEYPAGVTLARYLHETSRRGLSAALDVIVRLFADVAEGLHHAHTDTGDDGAPFGWAYRSLTPSALLLGDDGRGTVVDWGLDELRTGYAHIHAATRTGLAEDKVSRYVSPEQVRGAVVDGRSDVFALGVMLYEASTGSKPFVVETELGFLEALIGGARPLAPSELVTGYPPALERLVMRALEREPAARISAGEMAEGLLGLREREGGSA
jgi:serine/threonine protein kinase